MRKMIMAISAPVLVLMLACGSGQGETKVQTGEKSLIAWQRFDDALNQAAQVDKPVMAFFWRDG